MRRAAILAIALAGAIASAPAADPASPVRSRAQPCATCHGPLGLSNAPDTPNLAGQPRTYLEAQLKSFRAGKRSHEVMNVVAKSLSDADIADLAEWYSGIVVEVREKR